MIGDYTAAARAFDLIGEQVSEWPLAVLAARPGDRLHRRAGQRVPAQVPISVGWGHDRS
jgi:hypothetical protein